MAIHSATLEDRVLVCPLAELLDVRLGDIGRVRIG